MSSSLDDIQTDSVFIFHERINVCSAEDSFQLFGSPNVHRRRLRGREGEVDLFEGAYEEEKTKGERETRLGPTNRRM